MDDGSARLEPEANPKPEVDGGGKLTGEYSEQEAGRDDETWNAYIAAGQ